MQEGMVDRVDVTQVVAGATYLKTSPLLFWWQEGRKREGMVGLVDKPPSAHFAAIKRHYRHGVYSLSHKSQSLVWIEADGTWKEAWEGMKGEGEDSRWLRVHFAQAGFLQPRVEWGLVARLDGGVVEHERGVPRPVSWAGSLFLALNCTPQREC